MLMQSQNMSKWQKRIWGNYLWELVSCMDCALEFASAYCCFKIIKAEYLVMLHCYLEVQSAASNILQMDSTSVDVLYIQSLP